jgi:molybdopterin-containing oxidoreductase family iron-sulfur binding subunit
MDRREFVTLVGAALALTGFAGCGRAPTDQILPYLRQPEQIVPGKPLYYATAMPWAGGATGLLVRSDMGRPTKIEGNPRHPASLGGTDPYAQGAIYSLWDPDRSQAITHTGMPATWSAFLGALNSALERPRARKGAGLAVLTEEIVSPTLGAQLDGLLRILPDARWYSYEPLGRDYVRAGSLLAFGEDVEPVYTFADADVIVSLDADFLACGPGRERYSHDYTNRRKVTQAAPNLSRLYVIESTLTTTGTMADHRWAVRSSEVESVARALAAAVGVGGEGTLPEPPPPWVGPIARDLLAHKGRSVVVAGRDQTPNAQALAAAMNHALLNEGKTVRYIDPVSFRPKIADGSLPALADAMVRGQVEALVILGGNPVYAAPADLEFERRLASVKFRMHLGLHSDETSWQCHWHVPETHFLESWSDALAYEGTASILQPLISPLYEGRSPHELVAALAGDVGRRPYDLVREHWKRSHGDRDFEAYWSTALHEGIVPGTARPARPVALRVTDSVGRPVRTAPDAALEVVFRADPAVWDGRFSNNAWLQEMPRPITKLTWENAVLVGPQTAARLGLSTNGLVTLTVGDRAVRAPVWIQPGQAEHSVTVHLGYGRTRAGRIGTGLGFDAYRLRTTGAPLFQTGLSIRPLAEKAALASTQSHRSMEGRDLVRVTTRQEFLEDPHVITPEDERRPKPTLYPEVPPGDYAWGMLIDLNACSSCNACVVACQVENNVPVVGKSQVLMGREMHWLRVDTYVTGPADRPEVAHQPVPCMHCENAPCELVCPVNATVHSSEGLNEMVYNRCVGTRYCSNNCPYKVRHFNFFQYADFETPSFREMYNPEVTVRERGVMEKCSYCVQRITRARIEAEVNGRRIPDGGVKTACQQACPNGAILFGDLLDHGSEVARRKSSPLNYDLLGELNTRPRTTYLARVRNPNPELERL